MKNRIIQILQKILGFETYLFIFARFTYLRLPWDRNEKDFFKLFDLIKNDGLILDIGANIGVMTTHLSKQLPNSTILSFEPILPNYNTLKKMALHYNLKNVKMFDIGLSDQNGSAEMIMPVQRNARKQGLTHIKEQSSQEESEGISYEVTIIRLDEFNVLTERKQPIVAMKIDVEGHELNVLKGAQKILLKDKPIVYCELWPSEKQLSTIRFMMEIGFTPYILDNGILKVFAKHNTQNFFFLPN